MVFAFICILAIFAPFCTCFQLERPTGKFLPPSCQYSSNREQTKLFERDEKEPQFLRGFNPVKEISDMFQNFDDVIDDFLFKRMGNGEVFYGKRKYKPSGRPNTQGEYNGMGLSDKTRIDVSRMARAEFEEKRRQLLEQQRKND